MVTPIDNTQRLEQENAQLKTIVHNQTLMIEQLRAALKIMSDHTQNITDLNIALTTQNTELQALVKEQNNTVNTAENQLKGYYRLLQEQ